MIVGVIGLGEVGGAIHKLCRKKHEVFGRTRHIDELKGKSVDVLHLCYPYTDTFVKTAVSAVKELTPKLVIIDSSVKPGTTKEIFGKTHVPMVHAPIIGKHPGIYRYLFEMEKIIGPVNEKAFKAAKKHFEELGVKTIRFRSSLESEIAKLLSTTYYGWNIIYEKFVHSLCEQTGANFNDVYARFNQLYNMGYQRTLPNVRRPVLKHQNGGIGGHCVIPNAKILSNWQGDEFTAFLLAQDEKAKKTTK